ncbi:MAG: RlmE family RNA methyltransferase [Ancalomicrobiaceae bacterium]|nr:RlmE family RNA methyltransferase [Ancalomicrobiaceae bacterium]
MTDDSSSTPRRLKVRVKTAKRRTPSSNRWLQRQLNDPYVVRSKADGYRSRAAYKLIEIDDKFKLLAPGNRVVDLGCAPGGWLQVAVARVGSTDGAPRVVGIDYLDVDPVPGTVILKKDFLDDDAPAALHAALGGHQVDVVLSDMAAPATGHKKTDQLKITYLCEVAIDFARRTLRPGGHFVAKVLRGGTENQLLAELKRDFAIVAHVKPPASRSDSAELYVLGKGFRGRAQDAAAEPEAGEA